MGLGMAGNDCKRGKGRGSAMRSDIGAISKEIAPFRNAHRTKKFRLDPEHSALLVIDMQRYFLDEKSHAYFPEARKIVDRIAALVDAFRDAGSEVLFTRHALLRNESPGIMGRWWGDVLRDDDEFSEIIPELRPKRSEAVIRKTTYSAFKNTDLENRLRASGVEQLVITGVMTHLCCETTARDAFVRNYEVFFVIDGTATYDDRLHASSLRNLTDGFAIPLTTEEVMQCLRRKS